MDPNRRVVIFKVTYLQHKYNHFNVLEDRAMSVVKQEVIHPVHGGRETTRSSPNIRNCIARCCSG